VIAYSHFETEQDLLADIFKVVSYDAYPRVTAIGGKKIVPDIDVLEIRPATHGQQRLLGYEIKLMRYDKRSKGLTWGTFYKGIGQALMYLLHGVQKVGLVLGFQSNVPDELIEDFSAWLNENKAVLALILGNYLAVHLHLYSGNPLSPTLDAKASFLPQSDPASLRMNELIHGNFTYDKRLKYSIR
jgi:hypothetical protein